MFDRSATARSAIATISAVLLTAAGGLFAIGLFDISDGAAQTARKAQREVAPTATGCGSSGAIGLSRTVEIDTTQGPQFGQQQYKGNDFLADGEIVLTFDDGPLRPYTVPVLKALDAHCTKATFFVVGRQALFDPALVKDTAARGHTIGTHTYSHSDARKLGPNRSKADAELGISAVSRALGKPVAPFFRFPYLSDPATTLTYLRGRQMGIFSIDVDGYDYRTQDPAAVHRAIVSQLTAKRKGILLFHDIQPATAGALHGLLLELKSKGFKVVHMVPKTKTATLAEFDGIAEKEAAKKTPGNPLASKAIVWGADPPAKPQPSPSGAPRLRTSTNPTEALPWKPGSPAAAPAGASAGTTGSIAAPPPGQTGSPPAANRPRTKSDDDADWATRLFR
jgi:peptidoglycan/xylan/chitin deacetylase (PgdA/CDA1 family)